MSRAARLLPLACLVAFGCRTPRPTDAGNTISADEVRPKGGAQGSTLGSGDLLEVRVFQEPDLSGPFRLSPEGTIDFPLCGKAKLSGMTSSQAADALTACLRHSLKRPEVTVLIREYNSKKIFIFGEVQKPGTFPYDENMSIIQAVTLAGGFTRLASKNNTQVTRLIEGQEKKIRVPVDDIGVGRERNFQLQPGDIVFVPESLF